MNNSVASQYSQQGFVIIPACIPLDLIEVLSDRIESARQSPAVAEGVSNSSGVFAIRNLTDVVPEVTDLIQSEEMAGLTREILGPDCFMVRATLFDKTEGANWGVFWHQDLSIAVQERHNLPGYSSWTRKAGVQCVQPPPEILSQIMAVRVHLDPCAADNGALRVLPGSHRLQKLSTADIENVKEKSQEVVCEVPAGGVVLMNPLLLHASAPMQRPGSRRVIHLEFTSVELLAPLQWRYRIPVRQTPG